MDMSQDNDISALTEQQSNIRIKADLPVTLQACGAGDILAVLATGAYNYSMSSNYNRLPRPAVVMVKDGASRVVVKAETYEDLVRNDL